MKIYEVQWDRQRQKTPQQSEARWTRKWVNHPMVNGEIVPWALMPLQVQLWAGAETLVALETCWKQVETDWSCPVRIQLVVWCFKPGLWTYLPITAVPRPKSEKGKSHLSLSDLKEQDPEWPGFWPGMKRSRAASRDHIYITSISPLPSLPNEWYEWYEWQRARRARHGDDLPEPEDPRRPDLSALGPSQAVLSKRMEHVWDAQCHACHAVMPCQDMPNSQPTQQWIGIWHHLTYLTNVTMHNHPEEMRVKQQKDAALASRGLGRHKEQLPRSAARKKVLVRTDSQNQQRRCISKRRRMTDEEKDQRVQQMRASTWDVDGPLENLS